MKKPFQQEYGYQGDGLVNCNHNVKYMKWAEAKTKMKPFKLKQNDLFLYSETKCTSFLIYLRTLLHN